MSKAARGALAHLAVSGAELAVRVTPKASRARIVADEGEIRVYVTEAPEDGKATEAVRKALAKALGFRTIQPLYAFCKKSGPMKSNRLRFGRWPARHR